jgi:hypothetical protein
MSGTTSMQIFEINAFGGLNLQSDSRKIKAGEFTSLINANVEDGSIKADAVDSLLAMPISKVLYNGIGSLNYEHPWRPGASGGNNQYATFFNESLATGDNIEVAIPFYLSGIASADLATANNEWIGLSIYNYTSATIPSARIDAGIGQIAGFGYCEFTTGVAGYGSGSFYVTHNALIASAATGFCAIINRTPSASGYNGIIDSSAYVTQKYSTAGVVTATAAWVTNNTPWSCVIVKNTFSGGHVLNIYPFITVNETRNIKLSYAAASANHSYYDNLASGDQMVFSRLWVPDEPNYKNSFFCSGNALSRYQLNRFTEVASTNTNRDATISNDFNLIEASGGARYISVPETKNSILVDFDPGYFTNYFTAYRKLPRKSSHCVFQDYLIIIRNGAICAYKFNVPMSSYAMNVVPLSTPTFTAPRGVITYNNYLIFYNVIGLTGNLRRHRMYFSAAGQVDSFSTTQYENLSDGKEILWIEKWYGSLIIFFADEIKRYTGTPGNASLETIFYKGVSCGEMVCKTGRGIFFLSNDGLYVFDGSFTKVTDLSQTFDFANIQYAQQDGWMEFNNKKQELYFYPGYDSKINIWNAQNNYFRQKDYTTAVCSAGMRLFNYYDNADLKTAISYPSITHISKIEGGSTYQPVTAQSGWIDPSEGKTGYDQKHFDSAIIEYKQASAAGTFDAYIYTDDLDDSTPAASASATSLSGSGSFGSLKLPINRDAKLFRYKLISPAQNAQLNVSKIKILYNDTILK